MEKSKVYFTSFKTSNTENLLGKLRRLMLTAGIGRTANADTDHHTDGHPQRDIVQCHTDRGAYRQTNTHSKG